MADKVNFRAGKSKKSFHSGSLQFKNGMVYSTKQDHFSTIKCYSETGGDL